jgi:LPS-assembly protein
MQLASRVALALVVFLQVGSLALVRRGHAQAVPGILAIDGRGDEPLTVDADDLSYDREADTIRARGDVIVTVGGSVLAADEIEIDRKKGQAEASGSVVLEDPQGRIRAERASFLLEDETGYLEEGYLYLPQSRFQITGARLEKGIGQSYRIWDGTLTTCQCEDGAPDWSISGEEIDLELGGWGRLRDGVFKIKDRPILYLPYGIFPLLRDRQTGFLFPRVGYETSRGFQYVQPFYWAIDKSSDATISLDVETSARIGLLAEYRYLWSATAGGNLGLTYFNERIRGTTADEVVDPQTLANPEVPENRGSVIGYHQQLGPGGSRIYLQPFLVSDNLFLRDMNVLTDLPYQNINLTTLRYTTSKAGIAKVWDWGLAKAEATWKQDLIGKQSRVPQALPRVTLDARHRFLDSGLLLRLTSEAVEYYRAPLSSGPRFDFAPEAQLPFRLGPYAYGNLRLILRETVYYLFDNEVPAEPFNANDLSAPVDTRIVPHYQHREILQMINNVQSEVSRVFDVDGRMGSIRKLKHTIEPFLQYNYVPVVNQTNLPLWDALDRINARNALTYGVTTRLLAKVRTGGTSLLTEAVPSGETLGNELVGDQPYGPPAAPTIGGDSPQALEDERIRELARATVRQSYEISQPVLPGKHFSGVEVGARVTPVSFFGVQGRLIYSVETPQLQYATVGANLWDPRPIAGPDDLFLPQLRPVNSLSVFYQFTGGGAVENLNVAATYRVTNNLALSYLTRFDALDNSFLENWAGFRLISSCDCWVIDFAFIDRVNPDTTGVRVQVSLVGLGSFGQQPFPQTFAGAAVPRAIDPTGVGRSY